MYQDPAPQLVSEPSAEALELPSLLLLLAELTSTDLGRQRALGLRPTAAKSELEGRHCGIREAAELLEEGALIPSFDEPLLPLLAQLESSQISVSGKDLMQLAAVLGAVHQATEHIRTGEGDRPTLRSLGENLESCEPLRRRIAKSLDRRGRVRDDASPALRQLRKAVHGVRDQLYKQLHGTLDRNADHFSETTVSLKDGRLTLLLQAGSRGRLDGLVHGRSGTGQSFYFEPLEAVEGNNRLQDAIEEEEAERRRILAELVVAACDQMPSIHEHFQVLAELDLIQSVCRFGDRTEAHLPELASDGDMEWIGARHPLLDPALADLRELALGQSGHLEPVVPLDLTLRPGQRVLVITGPNAGGKTVALKTVGLLTLMAQCGLPVPAKLGSRVPLFNSVMAMLGDEQDLLTDQSTFSARLIRLKEAWQVAGPHSLVLLDELGSGTDPEEGAALAMSLLEGLLESGSAAILTTHLTQLAASALEHEGATCAAMEFDPDSGRPTYQLRPGAPGGSQALALARRLGLPQEWLRRAEELLGSEHRDLRRLLREVERVRQELASSQAEVQRQTQELADQQQVVVDERTALEEERRRLADRLRHELREFRQEVTRNLRGEVDSLRQQLEEGRRKGLVAASVERLFEESPSAGETPEDSGAVELGSRVRHRDLGWEGRLEKIRDDMAEVVVRGKRVRCGLAELGPVGENAGSKKRRSGGVELEGAGLQEVSIPTELNLLGMRVEPALEELDRYLDRALLSSLQQVRVVHGFGTGKLRRAVRQFLKPHPAVAELRAGRREEGGDGATVVTLDKA